MSALREIIHPGDVTVIYGAPANMQALAAEEIAFRAARSGRRVVVLCDGEADKAAVLDRIIGWRAAKGVAPGERMQITAINERDFDRSGDLGMALLQKLHDLEVCPHLIVSSALALDPQGLNSHIAGRYIGAARMLAAALGCAFLLAGHTGPGPNTKPEIADAALWQCVGGRNLSVTLNGPGGQHVELVGRTIGGSGIRSAIILDDVLTEEPVS